MAKAHHTQLKLDKYHEDEDCDANGGKAIAGDWVLLKKAAMSED